MGVHGVPLVHVFPIPFPAAFKFPRLRSVWQAPNKRSALRASPLSERGHPARGLSAGWKPVPLLGGATSSRATAQGIRKGSARGKRKERKGFDAKNAKEMQAVLLLFISRATPSNLRMDHRPRRHRQQTP